MTGAEIAMIGSAGAGMMGGGGSSGGVEAADLLNRIQKKNLKALGGYTLGAIGQGADVFGGQRVAGFSPLQQNAQNIFGGLSPAIGSALGGGLSGLGQSRDSLAGYLGDFDQAQSQRDFQQGVVNPAMRNFQQNIMPSISERLSNVGGTSGVLSKAFAQAGGDLQSDLSAQGATFNQNARDTHNQNRLNASNQLAGQSQLGLNFINTLSNIGSQQRDVAQQGLGADFSRWSEGQSYNNPILKLLPLVLGTQAHENIVTQGGGGFGEAVSELGGAFLGTEAGSNAAIDLFNSFGKKGTTPPKTTPPSDRRLKTDITLIGILNGIKYYIWNWNELAKQEYNLVGSSTGVIAQEVMEVLPEAVKVDHKTGFFVVDYGIIKDAVGE